MSELNTTDPLKVILELNKTTATKLEQIDNIYINQENNDNATNDNQDLLISKIKNWFTNKSPTINKFLSNNFFPILIESMAGSDAICIKGMTSNYAENSLQLDHQWQYSILPILNQLDITRADKTKLQNWKNNYQTIISLCNDELIPMADRLLDNDAITEISLHLANINDNHAANPY